MTLPAEPDRPELIAVVSPYHLSSREAPALAALQLADHTVTLTPAPSAGRVGAAVDTARATEIARAAPLYAALVDSMSWCAELFREGVLASAFSGDDAAEDARDACDRVGREDWLAPLRPLVRPELFEDDRSYLSAVARDVLRGGPDPALSIPLAAGLDAFARRHGLVVARAEAASVAQKAEVRLARELCRFALPVLVQGSADRVLLARALLGDALADLRAALADLAAGGFADASSAARGYAAAFAAERDDLLAPPGPNDDDDEVRPVDGTVSVRLVELPADAVFASSVRAAALLDDRSQPSGGTPAPAAEADPVVSMVIKVIGRR